MSPALERVQKLMRLALNNPSVEEAKAAALKAVQMIAEHTLTVGEAAASTSTGRAPHVPPWGAPTPPPVDFSSVYEDLRRMRRTAYAAAEYAWQDQLSQRQQSRVRRHRWVYDVSRAAWVNPSTEDVVSASDLADAGCSAIDPTDEQCEKAHARATALGPPTGAPSFGRRNPW